MTKKTLTIAIPAYNEEKNIARLLRVLLKQDYKNYLLKKILVISDGSTDNTASKVKQIRSSKIKLIESKNRTGKFFRENQIFSLVRTDALVILDADIFIKSKNFIKNLLEPLNHKADLVSCRMLNLEPTNFFQKILQEREIYQDRIFSEYKNGLNVYTCHGVARAFSKKLYKKFKFVRTVGEDAYSYFYTLKNNFKYAYAKNSVAYIRLPQSLSDHALQGIRFVNSKEKMEQLFGRDFVQKNYKFPLLLGIKNKLISAVKSPFYFTLYVLVNIYTNLLASLKNKSDVLWVPATSSK